MGGGILGGAGGFPLPSLDDLVGGPEIPLELPEIPGLPGVGGDLTAAAIGVGVQLLGSLLPQLGQAVGGGLGIVAGELGLELPQVSDALRKAGLDAASPLGRVAGVADLLGSAVLPDWLRLAEPLLKAFSKDIPALGQAAKVLEQLGRTRTGAPRRNFDELLLDASQDPGLEVPDWVKALVGGLAVAAIAFAERAVKAVGGAVEAVGRAAQPIVSEVAGVAFEGIEVAHSATAAAVEVGAGVVFSKLRDQLDGLGESTPENVDRNATKLLATATGLGMTAHLLSELTETVYFTKHLGLPNLAAFLVDMASYRPMADALLGAEYRAALAEPATRRANVRFRPSLPGAGVVDQMFLEKQIGPEEFRQFYREQGWADKWITAHEQEVFREASLFALASALEDAEVDPGWVDRQLIDQGFDEESVTNLRRALGVRSQKSVRGQVLAAASRARKAGLLTDAGAEKLLAPLRLRPEAVALWQAATGMDRLVEDAEALRRVLEDGTARGQFTDDVLRAELAALGYDASAQAQSVELSRRRRGLESFREETAEQKRVVRQVQADRVTTALEAFRRRRLSVGELQSTLTVLGLKADQVDAAVDRALIQREPVPQLATVLSPEAQVQRLLDLEADAVLTRVRKRELDPAVGLAALLGLGTEPARAAAEVDLALARRVAPPAPKKPPAEPPATRETRELRTEAVLARLREGLLSPEQARASLAQLGHPPETVAAFLEREAGRAEAAAARAAVRAETQQFETQRRALEEAALAAFRRGDLEPADLLALLVGIGRAPAVAEALVTREVARRGPRTAPARPPGSSS